MCHQRWNVGCARIHEHRDHRHQHQNRAEEGIKEELEARVNTVRAAPDANDQEHRDQARFEEDIKEHEIQRHEHAEHQRLKQQEGDHVFLDARFHIPACRNNQRHHEGGQHHEEHGNTVHAHFVGHAHDPGRLFHHLEAGVGAVELREDKQ